MYKMFLPFYYVASVALKYSLIKNTPQASTLQYIKSIHFEKRLIKTDAFLVDLRLFFLNYPHFHFV